MLKLIAKMIALPRIADWLIRRAQRTPYFHIKGEDGSVYMERYWLFNPYPSGEDGGDRRWGDWMPSIRIHRIMREDQDRHLHDHPWNARTFILSGWYFEVRPDVPGYIVRLPGQTATLRFGEYHRIAKVSSAGAWTLFITWRKRGTWGFMVDGVKVPWRTYLGIEGAANKSSAENSTGQEGGAT